MDHLIKYLVSLEKSLRHRHGADFCLEMGKFLHACEGELVCESVNPKVPFFNAPIYLENKVRPPPHILYGTLLTLRRLR